MPYKEILETVTNFPGNRKKLHEVLQECHIDDSETLEKHNIFHSPAAHFAYENNSEAVEFLLGEGANINYAVKGAAEGGCIILMNALLARGASIDFAVFGAAMGGREILTDYLLKRGADLDDAFLGATLGEQSGLSYKLTARGADTEVPFLLRYRDSLPIPLSMINILVERVHYALRYILDWYDKGYRLRVDISEELQRMLVTNRGASIEDLSLYKKEYYLDASLYIAAFNANQKHMQKFINAGGNIDYAIDGLLHSQQRRLIRALAAEKADYALKIMEACLKINNIDLFIEIFEEVFRAWIKNYFKNEINYFFIHFNKDLIDEKHKSANIYRTLLSTVFLAAETFGFPERDDPEKSFRSTCDKAYNFLVRFSDVNARGFFIKVLMEKEYKPPLMFFYNYFKIENSVKALFEPYIQKELLNTQENIRNTYQMTAVETQLMFKYSRKSCNSSGEINLVSFWFLQVMPQFQEGNDHRHALSLELLFLMTKFLFPELKTYKEIESLQSKLCVFFKRVPNKSYVGQEDKPMLYRAAEDNNTVAVITLLQEGKNPNGANKENGETALHLAVKKNNLAQVRVLLENGADPNLENIHKENAYTLAEDLEDGEILNELIEFSKKEQSERSFSNRLT